MAIQAEQLSNKDEFDSPSYADAILQDQTTMYVVNNLYRLDFGSVDIANIFPALNGKPSTDEQIQKENLGCIVVSAAKADSFIIAWGKAGDTNKAALKQQDYVMRQLEPFREKMLSIGFHPLAPRMRAQWQLKEMQCICCWGRVTDDKHMSAIYQEKMTLPRLVRKGHFLFGISGLLSKYCKSFTGETLEGE